MANVNPRHVVTGRARLSYAVLSIPKPGKNGGEPKYSVTVLVPKIDFATKQRIDAAISAAIAEGAAKLWGGLRPPILGIPVYDGDGARPSDGLPFGKECKGHWVFTASSKNAPGIVDLQGSPIIRPSEIYSGIYAHVGVTFFAYNNEKKGVGCGLENVIKIEDGEPLGGGTPVSEDLAAITGQYGAPAPAAAPYVATAYPPVMGSRPIGQVDPITGQPLPL